MASHWLRKNNFQVYKKKQSNPQSEQKAIRNLKQNEARTPMQN